MLHDNTWLRYAQRANALAELLERRLQDVPGLRLLFPRQANSVFVQLPPSVSAKLAAKWKFYTFIGSGGARFMCAWDTTEADIAALADDLESLVTRSGAITGR
jgi:threonine aldolase